MTRCGTRSIKPWAAAGCVLVGVLASAGVASAEAVLDVVSGSQAKANAGDDAGTVIRELGFDLDIGFTGVVAEVSGRHSFVSTGRDVVEARYTFDLPADAAVTGVTIELAGGRTSAMAVLDADAAVTPVPDPDAVAAAPDLGLLRLVARDVPGIDGDDLRRAATYELRVYPVAPDQPVTVTINWVAPLRYDDGRLLLRIPDRGGANNLVRERVALRLSPPPGVRGFRAVNGGGQSFGAVRRARFRASPGGDLVIDAALDFATGPAQPGFSVSAVPLGDGFGALAVALLSPLPQRPQSAHALQYERMVLVLDRSRSLGRPGLAAADAVVGALLEHAPAATQIEAVLFDRQARRLFGSFRPNDGAARSALAQALRPETLANGSDLGAALGLVGELLGREPLPDTPAEGFERGVQAATLIVVVSDGMNPLELTPRRALDRLGQDAVSEASVAAVLLTPDTAPVPDTREGVLPTLAQRSGGQAVAVRFGEAEARAHQLAADVSKPSALTELDLELGPAGSGPGTAAVAEDIELPTRLEPGQGVIAIGFYRGPMPKRAVLKVRDRGQARRISARSERALSRHAGALALARARPEDFAGADPARISPIARRRALVAAAGRAGVVTRYSSAVVLDPRDGFARDRLAMIKSWGASAFFRLPPQPERQPGHEFRRFQRRVRPDKHAVDAPARRTGALDRNIVARLLTTQVKPRARVCYEDALRRDPALAGELTIALELARGEVQFAQVEGSSFPNRGLEACIASAAYSIQVPRVALGDDPEVISVVRYPLAFARKAKRGEVRAAQPKDPALRRLLNSDDPLDGLD